MKNVMRRVLSVTASVILGLSCSMSVFASDDLSVNANVYETDSGENDDLVVNIADCKVSLSEDTFEFTGNIIKPSMNVSYQDSALFEGTDYVLEYNNNIKVGTASVTVNGVGNYSGTVTLTFLINPAKQEIQKLTTLFKGFYVDFVHKESATGYEISYGDSASFSSEQIKKISDNKQDKNTISDLKGNSIYFVRVRSYTVVNSITYYGEWSDIQSVVTAGYDFAKCTVKGISGKAYTGKSITQNLVVSYGKTKLSKNKDYKVSYSANKKIGTAKVSLVGMGKYIGKIAKNFNIYPAKQDIQKLISKQNGFYIDYIKKNTATGYEILYATKSDFSNAKTLVVKKKSADTQTIKGLKASTKYYVKVRSYTVASGKTFTGYYSSTKVVTTKSNLKKLETILRNNIKNCYGNWSVYVKNLNDGSSLTINDRKMYAASLIKLYAMSGCYTKIGQGKISEKAVSSTLYNMITWSSNDAFNSILRTIGKSYINTWCKANGYAETYECHGLSPSSNNYGLATANGSNYTSVKDCGKLLESIYNKKCVSKAYSEKMLKLLLQQHVNTKIPKGVPNGVKIAHKTGETTNYCHDVGIVYSKGATYIVCIMGEVRQNGWASQRNAIAISRTVYNYFNK